MFDVAAPLMQALANAQMRLHTEGTQTSLAQTPLGGGRADAAMARTAQEAIFTQALLNATHARLAELKITTHG